ncbi:PTS fructose transporter subunit IIABC [Candidatus Mycoplasma pogonae]
MDIFHKNQIFLKLDLKQKDSVFEFVAQQAKALGVTNDPEALVQALHKRENEVSTAFENEFAIPHAQSVAIEKPMVFFMSFKHGIEWQSLDNQLTKYAFCILVPQTNASNDHMEALSKIATLLLDSNKMSALKNATTSSQVANLLNSYLDASQDVKLNPTNSQKPLVVGVTACAVGVAHTYLAAQKLEKALAASGYDYKIETRGSAGTKNEISDAEIARADFVIVASDIELDLTKFAGKKVYETSTKQAIHKTETTITQAAKAAKTLAKDNNSHNTSNKTTKTGIIKHILSGVSHMIPFVIVGGLLIALSLGLGKALYGSGVGPDDYKNDFLYYLFKIGEISFGAMIGILGAYIAYSIGGRAALMPAFVVSMIGNSDGLFYKIGGIDVKTPLGFIGAILLGILVGYTVKWINTWKVPQSLSAVIPIFFIPLGVTLFYGLIVIFLIGAPIGYTMDQVIGGIKWIFRNEDTGASNYKTIIFIAMGALIGAMAGFDMGGPVNKVAFLTSTALITEQIFQPMGMMAAAIPVAPLGMGLATLLFRKKFTGEEKTMGVSALIMGMIGISEGAIPFAVADPKKVIISNVLGSAVAGAIAGGLSVTNAVAHGGPIVAILGAVSSGYGFGLGILYFFIAIIAGVIVTALTYGFWKKADANEGVVLNTNFLKSIWKNKFAKRGAK